MDLNHIPWNIFFAFGIKLLSKYGFLPGAVAAYETRRYLQKRKQSKAMDGWPLTEARVFLGTVESDRPGRFWAVLIYSCFVEEYRSGSHLRRFRKEEQADDFVRLLKDKRIQIRYNSAKPDDSVILDSDLEMLVPMAPQRS